jgi:ATP-dependent Clp endopeptidase proteolytic subunit ClpP
MKKFSLVTKKKKEKTKEEVPEMPSESGEEAMDLLGPLLLDRLIDTKEKEEIRLTGIYGTINEERCVEAIYSMMVLHSSGQTHTPADLEDPESESIEHYKPFKFVISTYGGSASDMFSVYDVMRELQKDCEIHTVGLGKVMSAGVLLLAAGTKGKRKVGANCRIMIHGVVSGQHGHLHDVENEFEEAKLTQKIYVRALAAETNMTEAYLKKLIQRKTSVYFDAKQAIELGIADELM